MKPLQMLISARTTGLRPYAYTRRGYAIMSRVRKLPEFSEAEQMAQDRARSDRNRRPSRAQLEQRERDIEQAAKRRQEQEQQRKMERVRELARQRSEQKQPSVAPVHANPVIAEFLTQVSDVKPPPERIEQPEDAHVLKVLLLGAPNAGKSTLLNRLAGREISVASGKAQTTRSQILGAVTRDSTQLIFMDTPGVVPANVRSVVERSVITAPWNALRNDPDHIVIVVDAEYAVRHPVSGSSDSLFGKLAATVMPASDDNNAVTKRQPPRATLLLNKCDLVTADLGEEAAEKVLSQLEKRYASRYPLTDSVMRISAAKGTNIDQLEKHLVSLALPGAWELPAEEATNHSDAWLVAEVVRAEFYEHLHGVVPYRLRVKTVEWDESNGTMRPAAKVVVEVGDPGIKRIVIGQDGKIINSVLARATDRARASLGKAVRIDLKVRENMFAKRD